MPPLLYTGQGQGFDFHSYGGCNARVGPLHLVDVPQGSTVELAVTIEQLDFDPFAAKAQFSFWHIPPGWWAASWFAQRQRVDWTGLAARCQWIAANSAAMVSKAEGRAALADLVQELRLRAARFARLGALLAGNLGVAWQPVHPDGVPD